MRIAFSQSERFHIAQSLVQPGYGPVNDDIKQSGVVIAWYWIPWRRLCPEYTSSCASCPSGRQWPRNVPSTKPHTPPVLPYRSMAFEKTSIRL